MKILKYSLLSTLLMSSVSFATDVPAKDPIRSPTEQIILPSLIEVVSFCSSDKSCNSITPIIRHNDLNYSVKYKKIAAPVSYATDPLSGGDD